MTIKSIVTRKPRNHAEFMASFSDDFERELAKLQSLRSGQSTQATQEQINPKTFSS